MSAVDADRMAGIMASYEHGSLDHGNPFVGRISPYMLRLVEPYLDLGVAAKDDPSAAFATMGLLRGLAIGYEYRRQEEEVGV